MIGCAVNIARLMILATFFISGRRRSITSDFTRRGTSTGSARISSAFSIRTLTVVSSSPDNDVITSASIWSWLLRFMTSPTTLTMLERSTSGKARTPASTKAATFWVPDSSTIVKMVGPLVCLIWATSPSMATDLPIFVPRSAIRTVDDLFSRFCTWYTCI